MEAFENGFNSGTLNWKRIVLQTLRSRCGVGSVYIYKKYDGLAVIDQTPQKIEKTKNEIFKVFAKNNLRITIEANKLKVVNFLDVTLT